MSIINSIGHIKYTPVITLCDLQDDGTVKHISIDLKYNTMYEIMVFNPKDRLLYTVHGTIQCFGNTAIQPMPEEIIDYIILDTSKEKRSECVRIMISNIRSIKEIEEV